MILGLLLGFSALAVVLSIFGDSMSNVEAPMGEGGLRVSSSDSGDIVDPGQGGDEIVVGSDHTIAGGSATVLDDGKAFLTVEKAGPDFDQSLIEKHRRTL